jgi:catechol 2,3-dioxygenase-like lactoylglutathione lyase family enzyme
MQAKMSSNIALYHPDADSAAQFYREHLGMELVSEKGRFTELRSGPICIFLENGAPLGPVMEFYVPNVEEARKRLVSQGCTVVRWEGVGEDCYMKDPYGLVFNLWEDATSSESE